jgi:enterobactin synthetase component D / holo-[acyl-carrier protein] synthase
VSASPRAEMLERALRPLLPHSAVCCVAPNGSVTWSPYSEERVVVGSALPSRRHEFFTGRHCARRALARLDAGTSPIPRGLAGDPQWPVGVSGSIAHGGRWCIAVAASKAEVRSLGVDVEVARPIDARAASLIEPPSTRPRGGADFGPVQTNVVFAAKEAFYKAARPLIPFEFDFVDVRIEIASRDKVYVVPSTSGIFQTDFCVPGRVALLNGHVWMVVALDERTLGGFSNLPASG